MIVVGCQSQSPLLLELVKSMIANTSSAVSAQRNTTEMLLILRSTYISLSVTQNEISRTSNIMSQTVPIEEQILDGGFISDLSKYLPIDKVTDLIDSHRSDINIIKS